MFVENYRLDSMIGGQVQSAIPYPKISDEDWQKWKAFLPVKSVPFCKKLLLHKKKTFLKTVYGIPPDVCDEMVRGTSYFEEIEIWGKREIYKDPIAVGITENGARHLICRWGKDKLIPFESIKSRSWLYHLQNFGLILLATKEFWLSTLGAAIIGALYFGLLLHP
jgi:hypothetical protein